MIPRAKSAKEIAMTEAVNYARENIPDCLFTDDEIRELVRNAFVGRTLNEDDRQVVDTRAKELIRAAAARHKKQSPRTSGQS